MAHRTVSSFKISPQNITIVSRMQELPYIHGMLLSVWDNILGPKIQHAWLVDVEHGDTISHDVLNYASTRVLNSSDDPGSKVQSKFFVLSEKGILLNALVFGGTGSSGSNVCAISLVLPYSELKWYMPIQELCMSRLMAMVYKFRVLQDRDYKTVVNEFTSICVKSFVRMLINLREYRLHSLIDINMTVFATGQENQLDVAFIRKAISSHLQTCGCSLVIGSSVKEVNTVISTLALFLSPSERQCSCYLLEDNEYPYQQGLYIQGLLINEDVNTNTILSNYMRDILTNQYPTTLIDINRLEVKQTPPCNEHYSKRHEVMSQELQCLWLDDMDEILCLPPTAFHIVETDDVMLEDIMAEVYQLHPGSGVREAHIEQFIRLLDRKALALIKYMETETNRGKCGVKSSMIKRARHDLSLADNTDWRIILARAEKLKPGMYSFICGVKGQSSEPPTPT
ncbi:guanine nucleotide exchange factor C9orf72-like [Saccoglossus kowalevskii]|uniref:Protein C9orf72-like n=1 Tax=Saccoglossus kowalevskii TaxID=10224 RepID=A0ABM0GJQ4_SACKO|nr:PREDICTED: protein C9orf72-like [Saccoglossus kowalevskii]